MRGTFFYTATIAFAGGIFLRSFFDIDLYGVATLLFLGSALLIIWHRQCVVEKARRFSSPLFLVALIVVSVSLGMTRLHLEERAISPLRAQVDSRVMLEAVVVREPDERETTTHLYSRIDGTDEVVLVFTDSYQSVTYGDRIAIEGELTVPEPFETDLGRTFDYPGYLKARGVTYTIPFADIEVLESGAGNPLIAGLLTVKAKFTRVIEQILPEPQVGLGEGLLLGMKRALGDDLEEAFRRTGIIHIVVLSGYNVMLVAEAIMRLLSFVLMPRVRMAIGVATITAFALLVGLSATVVRASIMASLILIARATGRTYAIARALMIAGIIMLIVNPYLLAFDPGFQLSFLATLGLILLAPLIETKLRLVPSAYQVREFVTATISTQIFVSPLLLYLMGSISVVAVIVNVLVLPAVPFAMLFTFATGVLGAVSAQLASIVGLGAHVLLTYIIIVAEFFSAFSFAMLDAATFPFWLTVLLYGGIGALLYWMYTQKAHAPQPVPVFHDAHAADRQFDLSDWTIEEERDTKTSGPFPFR